MVQNKLEDLDDLEAQQLERIHFEDQYHELITKAGSLSIREWSLEPQIVNVSTACLTT